MWDPAVYRKFGEQRSRPFYELVARIGADAPRFVADLGCGPGELTAELCARWPDADVLGVDSSPEMIEAARELLAGQGVGQPGPAARQLPAGRDVGQPGPAGSEHQQQPGPRLRLRFELADVRDWEPGRPPDVIVSNALLQWVPEHERLLTRWAGQLAPGGCAVPANFGQPSHTLMRDLANSAQWRRQLHGVEFNRQNADPGAYLDLLARAGCAVDAWETTYLHVLDGEDAVLRWYEGTGLRPVLTALEPNAAAEFKAEYAALLRESYPRQPYGTVLPFRRVLVVARRPG